MKAEHKDLSPVEKALLTWYKPDNDKYNDPLHPTMKLAGEVGELLDLYAKHLFKPGFNWMNCKCGYPEDFDYHYSTGTIDPDVIRAVKSLKCKGNYTPLVLDELGDIWYYLRILAWQNEIDFADYVAYSQDELSIIKAMYEWANIILQEFTGDETIEALQEIYEHLLLLLEKLGYTIDQLTELNYLKLNSDDTNHGWKDAL